MVKDRDRPPMAEAVPALRAQQESEAGPSIVSVSIRGTHRGPRPDRPERLRLATRIMQAVAASGWTGIDAILLPGGYLRLSRPIGHRDEDGRRDALLGRRSIAALEAASREWRSGDPVPLLVAGIDLKPASKRVGGDQMVLAWRDGDLVGLARKTFPSHGDTDGSGPVYPVYDQDFASPWRFVPLPSGGKALLLGCYDAFGTRSLADARHADLAAMRLARDRIGDLHRPSLALRRYFLARWRALLAAHPPELALCAIHGFRRPGMDGYWQRHGIAGASAALGGIPVIGAAHFNKVLPASIERSVLAAASVPLSHLDLGPHRPMHALSPVEGFTLAGENGKAVALIRRFILAHRADCQRNRS